MESEEADAALRGINIDFHEMLMFNFDIHECGSYTSTLELQGIYIISLHFVSVLFIVEHA